MVEWKTDNLQPLYVYVRVHSVQVIFEKYVNNFVEVLAGKLFFLINWCTLPCQREFFVNRVITHVIPQTVWALTFFFSRSIQVYYWTRKAFFSKYIWLSPDVSGCLRNWILHGISIKFYFHLFLSHLMQLS